MPCITLNVPKQQPKPKPQPKTQPKTQPKEPTKQQPQLQVPIGYIIPAIVVGGLLVLAKKRRR